MKILSLSTGRHIDRCEVKVDDSDQVRVIGKCVSTGKPITIGPFPLAALERWVKGDYIQDALSMLDKDEREFLMTGYSKEAWDAMFKDDDDNRDEMEG